MSAMGEYIRKNRLDAGITLRAFALRIGISAAHQSDIEHGRRMPSGVIIARTARELEGVTWLSLNALDTRIDDDVKEWMGRAPAVRKLLRALCDSDWTGAV